MRFIIFLVTIFVIGMLVFGGNPVREFQRKQRELLAKYGTDDLTIRTNLYLEQQQNSGLFGGGDHTESPKSMLNSIKSSADADNNADTDQTGTPVKVAEPDDELPEDINVEVKDTTTTTTTTTTTKGGGGEYVKRVEKINNYYPPIVGSADETANQQKPIVLTGKERRLRSGQAIAFEGTSVYLIDNNGYKKPMPDGTYNMEDGSRITVSNGRSMR